MQDVLAAEIRLKVNTYQLLQPYPTPFVKRATQDGLLEIAFTVDLMEIPELVNLKTLTYGAERNRSFSI